jgi:phage antirepressor YoqD-like protein
VQILNYTCTEKETQKLLDKDIQTNVVKQNELRARQNDILIQEENNKVQMKQKELEVELAKKDNTGKVGSIYQCTQSHICSRFAVALTRKVLENDIRMKEMEIEIAEEHQRTRYQCLSLWIISFHFFFAVS